MVQHFAAPVAVITGDQHFGPEAAPFCPTIKPVVVKQSINRYAAEHLHPDTARALIGDGVRAAWS